MMWVFHNKQSKNINEVRNMRDFCHYFLMAGILFLYPLNTYAVTIIAERQPTSVEEGQTSELIIDEIFNENESNCGIGFDLTVNWLEPSTVNSDDVRGTKTVDRQLINIPSGRILRTIFFFETTDDDFHEPDEYIAAFEYTFQITGFLNDGETPCSFDSVSSQIRVPRLTIIDNDDPVAVTATFNIADPEVTEGAGATSVAKIDYALSRPLIDGEQCDIGYSISVVGGTAVQGTHINAVSDSGSSIITSNDNDETYVVDILDSGGGDGDKTVELEAVLTGTFPNGSSCELAGADGNQQVKIRKSFTIKDGAALPLDVSLSVENPAIKEGETTNVVVAFSEVAARSLAARNIETCQVTAQWTPTGTATEADYDFAAPEVITYRQSNPKTVIPLTLLEDSLEEPDETLNFSLVFGTDGVNNPCPLNSLAALKLADTVTIADTTVVEDPVAVTATFNIADPEVTEGAGSTSVAKIEYALSRALPEGEQCTLGYNISVVGGTAVQNTHLKATPASGSSIITSNDNDETYVVDILDSGGGDGDKTVELEAVLTGTFPNGSSCELAGADGNQQVKIRKSFAIKDDAALPLDVSLSVENPAIKEGETTNVVVAFSEVAARSLAARNIETCQVTAQWTPTGTATEADYDFAAPEIVTYQQSNPKTAIPLTLLEDSLEESDETLDFSLVLGTDGVSNPCPLSSPEPLKLADAVTITDTTVIVSTRETPEPEELLNSNCAILGQQASAGVLSAEAAAFLNSNCRNRDVDPTVSRNFEPEEVAAQGTLMLLGATRQIGNVRARLDKLRSNDGKRGVDVSSASLNIQDATISGNALSLGGAAGDDNALLENSRWGFFANGDYNFGKKKSAEDDQFVGNGDRKFDFNSKGLTLGADYRFLGEKLFAGVALGYKDFDSDFTTQAGDTIYQGYNLSVYSTYLVSDKSYIDALVSFGRNQIDSRRPVNNDGSGGIVNETTFAIGRPDAREIGLSIGGGYEFNQGEWGITPYGRIDYIKGTIDAYNESASHSSANASLFTINKQTVDSLTSTLGVRATRTINTSSGVFVPQASIEWKHEFKDRSTISGNSNYLSELGLPGGFSEENADSFDSNYFNASVGVSAVFPKGRSAYLNFESRFGDDQITDNAVKAGFRWEF